MGWLMVPKGWEMSSELRSWTKAKHLTDEQIEDEIESFRDHQYKKPMISADACWRNWVKNGIKWGSIATVRNSEYRKPEVLSTPQKKADILAFNRDMKRLGK